MDEAKIDWEEVRRQIDVYLTNPQEKPEQNFHLLKGKIKNEDILRKFREKGIEIREAAAFDIHAEPIPGMVAVYRKRKEGQAPLVIREGWKKSKLEEELEKDGWEFIGNYAKPEYAEYARQPKTLGYGFNRTNDIQINDIK